MSESLPVPRAPFQLEDPWTAPERAIPVRLRRATDGSTPRLATNLALWYDAEALAILFSGADDHVVATHLQHDAPLWQEDAVEAFLAPERLTRYFELEVSPRGTLFDAVLESPELDRRTMQTDLTWTCAGAMALVRSASESDGRRAFDILLRLPFASLGCATPVAGETWRANFFRIDRHPEHGDEFSAWQPTLRTPADFHVPSSFGTLVFGD